MSGISEQINGNEYVMNIGQSTWEDYGNYWKDLADECANAKKRETVIVVDGKVYYRAPAPEPVR